MKERSPARTPAPPIASETERIAARAENHTETQPPIPTSPAPPLADPMKVCDALIKSAERLSNVQAMEPCIPASYQSIKEQAAQLVRSLSCLNDKFSMDLREHGLTLRALIVQATGIERQNFLDVEHHSGFDNSMSQFPPILVQFDEHFKQLGIEIPNDSK